MALAIAMPQSPHTRPRRARAQHESVAAWRSGCPAAGAALVLGNEPHVRAFVRRWLRDGVDDAVQETLARGIAGRDRFGNRSSFRAFLLGVAWRVVMENYRTRKRHAGWGGSADEVESPAFACDDALHLQREVARLRLLFAGLPPKLRESLRMYYWESMTAREIATRLEISENTVRSRLRRGRERLRHELPDFG